MLLLALAALPLAAGLLLPGPVHSLATFTVDTTSDANLTACTATPLDCSLRGAINAANADAAADTIEFDVGAGTPTINVGSAGLPAISQPVTINGNTGGADRVELNGTGSNPGVDGLSISGGGSTVRGLVINRFAGDGIELVGPSGGNKVEGSFIGTDATGTVTDPDGIPLNGDELGNGRNGVGVNASPGNTIGGTAAAARNVISGNSFGGVLIEAGGASGNLVQGNFIGTDKDGASPLGNNDGGIVVFDAPSNTIGGTAAGAGNVISANGGNAGVEIGSGAAATGNLVQGNLIGTDKDGACTLDLGGDCPLGNLNDGVRIDGPSDITIGGTAAGARNVISGNRGHGVDLMHNPAPGNLVQGNFIGTTITGGAALGNAGSGVFIVDDASGNTIGGTTAAARNVISGNNGSGVFIIGGGTGNLVQGNFIGTDVTGTVIDPGGILVDDDELGNGNAGVNIEASGNIIGGTAAGAGNVISGNGVGVFMRGNQFGGPTDNLVQGNLIGTDVSGTGALGNSFGVYLSYASGNTIGGTTAGARNVISGNTTEGVHIEGTPAAGAGNLVQGNFIGASITGAALGNSMQGVLIASASDNTIGGAAAGAGNVIAFNGGDGVAVWSGTGNAILANSIVANAGLGIELLEVAFGVTPNDAGDGDPGANNLQNFPVLTGAIGGSAAIQGSLNSVAATQFRLEFFFSTACDPSANGEGQTFIGSATATTDVFGDANINVAFPVAVPAGQFITATASDPANNTSEFSACLDDPDSDGAYGAIDPCPADPDCDGDSNVPPAYSQCNGCSVNPGGSFRDGVELFVGTSPTDRCADTTDAGDEADDKWPMDFNDDGLAGLLDVLKFIPVYNTSAPGPPYDPRFDLNASGSISLLDVLLFIPFYNASCVP
ncbi:MAG: hypothetical protein Q7T33_01405 [Dehalococcoidia bacterium]|nr:hypothetical protein [Dehalococcoidia bacterium]